MPRLDVRALHQFRDPRLQFVDANASFPLGIFGSALQPQIIDLGEEAVLARHPAVSERFQLRIIANLGRLGRARSNALAGSLLQRRR